MKESSPLDLGTVSGSPKSLELGKIFKYSFKLVSEVSSFSATTTSSVLS